MALSSIYANRTVTRITGMASGLDTDTIIENLMQIEQLKVDKQYRQMTTYEWKADAYREVNNMLRTWREDYASVLGQYSTANYSTLHAMQTSIVGGTDTSAVTITASGSANPGTVTVNHVQQIASTTKVVGGKLADGVTSNSTLAEVLDAADWM